MAAHHSYSSGGGPAPKHSHAHKIKKHSGTSKHRHPIGPAQQGPITAGGGPPVVKKSQHSPRPLRGAVLLPGLELPLCVPEAIAASLLVATRYRATDEEVLAFYMACDATENGIRIEDALEKLMTIGLAGFKPNSYAITDKLRPGFIVGTTIPQGTHALTLGNDGVYSWGTEGNMNFTPEEIWRISWQK